MQKETYRGFYFVSFDNNVDHPSLSSLKSIISRVFGTDFSFPLCLKHIKSFKLSTNEFMKILINLSPQKQYLTVPGTLGDVSMAEQFIVVERELY